MKPLRYLPTIAKLLLAGGMLSLISISSVQGDDDRIDIDNARWSNDRDRLRVDGDKAPDGSTVTLRYGEKGDNGAVIGTTRADNDGDWEFRIFGLNPVPCDVTAQAAGVDDDDKEVRSAPDNCSNDGGAPPPPAAQCSNGIDDDGDGLVDFPADPGCADANDNDEADAPPPPVAQCADGIDNDNDGLIDFPADPGCVDANDNDEVDAPPPPAVNVSINSTSQNGFPNAAVPEQPLTGQAGFNIFASNDLGMHCGDLDTRISSILPPFNTVHAQVIQRGGTPTILTPLNSAVEVVYSAASNPNDPILTGINSAGSARNASGIPPLATPDSDPVASSMLVDGSVFKTNFWDIAREAYDAFYPQGILPAFYPPGSIVDLGLPMPNVEQLYLGDGNLTADQQRMNGILAPYDVNDPQLYEIFALDQPFFTSFPFGYTSHGVDWFEAAGIPLTAYDDFGRENPWPLMRVQARQGNAILASLDTVLPISGEANCGLCHNDPIDGGNGAATANLTNVALSIDDTANVPMDVSLEWAADINLVRLHDQKHGTNLIVGTDLDDPNSTIPFKAVVCQSCHYTPALDLAQLGPRGPENDGPLVLNGVEVSPSVANGADQVKHRSMSNVMHRHHATVTDTNGDLLFPTMPPAVDAQGIPRDAVLARGILMDTCYQCHPGRRTDCLRGAMATGGMLCQDCHGDMNQVGSDFTNNVSPANPGAFVLGADFYDPNSATPRVPWANEPGCGSCHTGDAMDNMVGTANTIADPQDGIRLMQAFRTGDAKATPIVPSNKRFAENTISAADAANPGAVGNPMLYRVSKGHGGVFCEGCHGATHGIWPNGNPDANDNVAAVQLQGHTGTIAECDTCHTNVNTLSPDGSLNSLRGPHGLHAIGDTNFARGDHRRNRNDAECRACHGQNGEGTVLSAMKQDRILECKDSTNFCGNGNSVLFPEGHQVGCTECHGNEL